MSYSDRYIASFTFACLFSIPATAQSTANAKTLHAGTIGASRITSTNAERVFFMQDPNGRSGFGSVNGVRISIQDSEGSTSEPLTVGFVRYGVGDAPDITRAGSIVRTTIQTPGIGTGRVAYRVTVSFATPVQAPRILGIEAVLPAPRSSRDALYFQRSAASRLLATTPRVQRAYRIVGNAAAAWLQPGETIAAEGLYEEGVARAFRIPVRSIQRVYGYEAYYPSSSAGDGIGFELQHRGFANAFVVPLVAPNLMATPLNFGALGLLQVPLNATVLPALALDRDGLARSPTFRVPSNIRYALQGVFLDLRNNRARFGDAIFVRTF